MLEMQRRRKAFVMSKDLKPFDIVRNEWAGNKNPQKILILISKGKIYKSLEVNYKDKKSSNKKTKQLKKD